MRARALVPPLLLLLALAPRAARAQESASLAVRVIASEAAEPVPAALVSVDGMTRGATDSDGRLVLFGLAPGRHRLEVYALARQPLATEVELPSGESLELEVALEPEPLALPGVNVVAAHPDRPPPEEREAQHQDELTDFYLRAFSSADGWFVTRAQLEAFGHGRLTDLLRMVPGVEIHETAQGPVARIFPRRPWYRPSIPLAANQRPPGCEPDYFVDGRHYAMTGSHDQFRLGDLEGVEVYVDRVPPRFNTGRASCGVIALWRR